MALTLSFLEGAFLISGGTGRVGEGTVRRLAAADVPVVFGYRDNRTRAEAIERELRDAGHKVRAIQLDLSDPDSVDAAFDAATAFGGRVAGVISVGGPLFPFARLADIPAEQLEQFVRGDAIGVFRLAARAVRAFRANGGGSITICTTIANYHVVDFDGASPFSKGSLEALIRQIAAEEADHGIRCNGVAVSWVNDLGVESQIAAVADVPEPEHGRIVALIRQIEGETRLRRPCSQDEAGDVFAWLASEQSRYITGQTIRLDGGFSL